MAVEGCRLRDFRVWHLSMELVDDIYRSTRSFPGDERFGLTAQLRHAAVSIPSNIGEGKRRKRERALLHHLDVALGSQGEVEVQLEIATRVGYLARVEYQRMQQRVDDVGRRLDGLIASIQPSDCGNGE